MQTPKPRTKDYLRQLTELLGWAAQQFTENHQFRFNPCFGAVAGCIRGNIFISCGAFGVALRLPTSILRGVLSTSLGTSLRYFSNGHVKREYAVLAPPSLNDGAHFKDLLNKSLKNASSTRPKDQKRRACR